MTAPITNRVTVRTTWKPAEPRLPLLYWLPSLARKAETYPPELLKARRAEFIKKIREQQPEFGSAEWFAGIEEVEF